MALYIDNGTTIDASWTKHIAVSPDGVNWSFFPKANTTVSVVGVNSIHSSLFPIAKGTRWIIEIKDASEGRLHVRFNPNEVANQATWLGNTSTAANQAASDITGWLGS
jgi:hypothetical protein